jgi:hypothetical protein
MTVAKQMSALALSTTASTITGSLLFVGVFYWREFGGAKYLGQYNPVEYQISLLFVSSILFFVSMFKTLPVSIVGCLCFGLPINAFLRWWNRTSLLDYVLAGLGAGGCLAALDWWLLAIERPGISTYFYQLYAACTVCGGVAAALAFWLAARLGRPTEVLVP